MSTDVRLGLSAQRVTFPQSRKILAEILEGAPPANRPSLPRTTIRGSPAATTAACTALMWRG